MKVYQLCILFSFLIFLSCNLPDEQHNDKQATHQLRGTELMTDTIPINIINPYDLAGRVHNELLYDYYYGDYVPTDLPAIISDLTILANQSIGFVSLSRTLPYTFTGMQRVSFISAGGATTQEQVLSTSLTGSVAREGFSDFLHSLFTVCEQQEDYAIIYDYITGFEKSVLESIDISNQDKEVILISTSIARHSIYAKKKRPKKNKDPEWAFLITNVIAAIDGADEGADEAVMRGLVCGIFENRE